MLLTIDNLDPCGFAIRQLGDVRRDRPRFIARVKRNCEKCGNFAVEKSSAVRNDARPAPFARANANEIFGRGY